MMITNRKKLTKDITCTNCGNKNHTYKKCSEPVTSWGVILVTYGDLVQPSHDEYVDLAKTDMIETQSRVLIESHIDRMIVSDAYYKIRFLMISRKNSVGYVEFIRGRYRPEKIDQVIYLFKQMMQREIDDIRYALESGKGFDYLWKKFWGNKAESQYLANDRKVSKTNFEMLKMKSVDGPELDLAYIVSVVKAEYAIDEWGFPKGRKNRFETEEECAIREFKEETGYQNEDFRLVKEIAPLVEDFTGTNGVQYRHIYYVAELITNKAPRNNITESQRDEIGNIQFMDFQLAIEYIREYHIPRKIVLERLFLYYLDKLVLSNRLNYRRGYTHTTDTSSRDRNTNDITDYTETTDSASKTNIDSIGDCAIVVKKHKDVNEKHSTSSLQSHNERLSYE